MSFATVVLEPTAKGDTLDGLTLRFSRTPTPLPAAASFRCEMQRVSLTPSCEKLNLPLEVIDSDPWEIRISPVPELTWEPGFYRGAIQAIDSTGRRKTYVHLELQVYQTAISE